MNVQVPKSIQNQSLTEITTNKPPILKQKSPQPETTGKTSAYGPKLISICPNQHIDHDQTIKIFDPILMTMDSGKLVKKCKDIPQPSLLQDEKLMLQSQSSIIEYKKAPVEKIVIDDMSLSCDSLKLESSSPQVNYDGTQRKLNMILKFPDYSDWSPIVEFVPGLKSGIEFVNQALTKIDPEVIKLFQEKKGVELLDALCKNPWVKQTLADSILITETKTYGSSTSSDFKTDVFGYNGNCNQTSFMMKYLLCTLADKTNSLESKELFLKLKASGGNNNAPSHTFLKLIDPILGDISIDPTIKQFKMKKGESSKDFKDLSISSKVEVLKCPMIYVGPSQEHTLKIDYMK